ncbi:putative protein MANBAL [Monocercomonoides exilis]|uniref:putative protein MANBAL n=1 Tax=Monocercomonoides exilis TaxID=2049356 RepID=UPI003559F6F4|nr:putative protein MANBAL [Monocercomonoides exilis]|eukprot:MONOS_14284.1-p1 / transcript=MONOS_14284.1 / gene=MONOS_14284 / organism=Monocercomonoides_exilis_PA203 / gene_product=MGC79829 protein / transcript_product=MGC79829 protein / location=Mono_scaffold00971:8576-10108(-) / protein_length=328 / sequence_SO=supercontig / SO=protein_coding / is_pseudo=false
MIRSLFKEKKQFVSFLAPMVRYSRLPFRLLCLKCGVDVVYSPMFVAEGFIRSQKARDADFLTTQTEKDKLIVQFAACNAEILTKASSIVANYCSGVDLNCGCPQKWAMAEGYGSEMLNHPDIIQDCVRSVRCNIPNLPISVKIRICISNRETMKNAGKPKTDGEMEKDMFNGGDMTKTLELVKVIENAGADYITIHGRTCLNASASSSVSLEAIKMVKETASIPVVANGDVFSLEKAIYTKEQTGVDGIMSARGLLQNPAFFTGCPRPPLSVFTDFYKLAVDYTLPFKLLHNHTMMMAFPLLSKSERQTLSMCNSPSMLFDICKELIW